MSSEVMKRALEAFEWNLNTDLNNIPACEQWANMIKTNITALRAALDAPEWVGLTENDIRLASKTVAEDEFGSKGCVERFAYTIEAKLKEKNT